EDVYIPLDRTNWFVFGEGDTLLFKYNTSAVDTYVIADTSTYYATINSDRIWEEVLEVSYEGTIQCDNCPITEFHRSASVVSVHGKIYSNSFEYSKTSPIEYQLGDTVLQQIYVLDDLPIDLPETAIKTVYYSDVFGIIRYDLFDDRVYELQLE
ncbi:MAG: hypothetical protein PVF73_11495, partial [Bacteroidales bacterium]